MKVLSPPFLVSTVCVAALLGGCSSSSGTLDDGLQDDPMGVGIDTDVGTDTGTNTGTDTGTNMGTDTGTDVVGADAGTDTDTDTDTGTDTGADTGTDTNTGTDAGADTGTSTTDEKPPSSDLDILVPNVAAGSDLERLITGIKRQVSTTLLDLNQRISQGVELTGQQETCIGAFDPAVGEQLLAINCEQALATGDVSVYVRHAAFYNTEDCHASIFNGNTDNCQLQRADMSLNDLFLPGERRPVLVYAGTNVHYAMTDTMLHIESLEPALTGPFSCDINLTSGNSSSPLDGTSCASVITARADHLDDVLPPN